MPAKFEDDLIWVAADTPLADSAFLSNKIKDLCGELPIFWLRPTYSSGRQTGELGVGDMEMSRVRKPGGLLLLSSSSFSFLPSFFSSEATSGGSGSNGLSDFHLTLPFFKPPGRERKRAFDVRRHPARTFFFSLLRGSKVPTQKHVLYSPLPSGGVRKKKCHKRKRKKKKKPLWNQQCEEKM